MCVVAILAATASLSAQPDIREILERSLEASDRNWKAARNYTFIERREERQLDSGGSVKSRRVLTYDITLLEGSPYRRLIERDGRPLRPEEERREEEKLRKSIEERARESPEQRARRLADYEKRRQREFELIREVPKAFDFRVAGEEVVSGVETWVLDATPRPGYEPRDRRARFFPKLKGRIWVSKQDDAWVRIDAEVIDTISFGLFLARLAKGSHLRFEQVRVNDEVWLPSRLSVAASARLALLKKIHVEQEIRYDRYRKFQANSRIVATGEVQ
jgi:hypothetical protein